MKKIFATLAILGAMTFGLTSNVLAQDDEFFQEESEQVVEEVAEAAPAAEEVAPAAAPAAAPVAAPAAPVQEQPAVEEEVSMFKALKIKFIEGDAFFMSFVALCLIIGLALCIERIIYLNYATTNTEKLLAKIEAALNEGGVEAAKEVCRTTSGPVASIFYQGFLRMDQGVEAVEKAVVSYGSVQMGRLESGLSWITLFIAIAPMLGFMGTVIGMIQAFDDIQVAGDISPNLVAGGMKVALITTVGGLIAAIILQVFYNYLISKVDSIVISMEDASISLVDMLVKYQNK